MKVEVKIVPNDKGNPAGKLCDAELHFGDDPLFGGLKLVGFSAWEGQHGKRTVTFPARAYSVNGERRTFALLRPNTFDGGMPTDALRDYILAAYAAHEARDVPGIVAQIEA